MKSFGLNFGLNPPTFPTHPRSTLYLQLWITSCSQLSIDCRPNLKRKRVEKPKPITEIHLFIFVFVSEEQDINRQTSQNMSYPIGSPDKEEAESLSVLQYLWASYTLPDWESMSPFCPSSVAIYLYRTVPLIHRLLSVSLTFVTSNQWPMWPIN